MYGGRNTSTSHHKFWGNYLIVLAKDLCRNTEIMMMLTKLVTELETKVPQL